MGTHILVIPSNQPFTLLEVQRKCSPGVFVVSTVLGSTGKDVVGEGPVSRSRASYLQPR